MGKKRKNNKIRARPIRQQKPVQQLNPFEAFANKKKAAFNEKQQRDDPRENQTRNCFGQTTKGSQGSRPWSNFEYDDSEPNLDQLGYQLAKKGFQRNNDTTKDTDLTKNFKTTLETMIVESKKEKADRIVKNQRLCQKTQELDEHWKELLTRNVANLVKPDEERRKPDDYDRLTKELIFEKCGEPSIPLKHTREPAKPNKNEININPRKGMNHRSADDIDDFYYESNEGEDEAEDQEMNANEEELDEEPMSSEENDTENESHDSAEEVEEEEEEEDEESDHTTEEIVAKEIHQKNLLLNYHEFVSRLKELPVHQVDYFFNREIKENGAMLPNERKTKLLSIFAYLLQYLNDSFKEPTENVLSISNTITLHLHYLLEKYSYEASKLVVEVMREKHAAFITKEKVLDLETVIFLKVVSLLFSTSECRHPVTTPAILFISQALSEGSMDTCKDITLGLFLATIAVGYCQPSNRIHLSTIQYLIRLLKASGTKGSHLAIQQKFTAVDKSPAFLSLNLKDLTLSVIDESFKMKCLKVTLTLLQKVMLSISSSSIAQYIAQAVSTNLALFEFDLYPTEIQQLLRQLDEECKKCKSAPIQLLVKEAKKPKTLRFLEPKQESVFRGQRKFDTLDELRFNRDKVRHKIKRELAGKRREIRRDTELFIKAKLKHQIKSDRKRVEKVKRIFADASVQQAEYKALERKKKGFANKKSNNKKTTP